MPSPNIDELVERAISFCGGRKALKDNEHDIRFVNDVHRYVSSCAGVPVSRGMVEKRLGVIAGYVSKLNALIENPGIPQRTEAWYAARETMVTGSELASAVGSVSSRKQFFKRKCAGPEGWNDLKDKPAIKWGVLYEPVANELYCRRSCTTVHEFGLLPHPTIPDFGASPDGVSDLGIMLEIKCPFSRVITGKVPEAYYAQIQAQLDTAQLDECDFLECKLGEYPGADEFLEDSHPTDSRLTKSGMEKGAVWMFEDNHEVSPDVEASKVVEWANNRPGSKYWYLIIYNRVRVKKEQGFIEGIRKKLDDAIAGVKKYRADPASLDADYPPTGLNGFSFIGL